MPRTKYKSMLERLLAHGAMSKTHSFEGTPCLEWTGKRQYQGYGHVSIWTRKGPRNRMVHRVMIEQLNGVKLASNRNGLHLCNNPPCFNPLHLRPGSQSANIRQCVEDGRHNSQQREPGEDDEPATAPC